MNNVSLTDDPQVGAGLSFSGSGRGASRTCRDRREARPLRYVGWAWLLPVALWALVVL